MWLGFNINLSYQAWVYWEQLLKKRRKDQRKNICSMVRMLMQKLLVLHSGNRKHKTMIKENHTNGTRKRYSNYALKSVLRKRYS